MFFHDGKTGETVSEITDSPHKGSIVRHSKPCEVEIYHGCFSSLFPGVRITSQFSLLQGTKPSNCVNFCLGWFRCLIDVLYRIGDVEAKKATVTWTTGSAIEDQQVGNTWSGEKNLVSLSLRGDLLSFDPRTPTGPSRVFKVRSSRVVFTSAHSL
jgi:hypothetical protein